MSARRTEDQIEERVSIDPSKSVEILIENQNGDVVVRGTDRSDILIRAEKHGDRNSTTYQEAELRIETQKGRIAVRPVLPIQVPTGSSGPSITVDLGLDVGMDFLRSVLDPSRGDDTGEQPGPERRDRKRRGFAFTWNSSDVSYEIEIEVPRAITSQLTVKTASGDVELSDLSGTVELKTASGDATCTGITGDLSLNTASGDLRLRNSAGQLTARSASGDVRVERSALRSLEVQTASGDLNLDAALVSDGPFQVQTVSGDCQLALAALDPGSGNDRGIAVSFHSMSGNARLDREFLRQGTGRWATSGLQPGPQVAVRTVSGDLRGSLGASREARTLAGQASDLPRPPASTVEDPAHPVAQGLVPTVPSVDHVPPVPPVPPAPAVPPVPPVPPMPEVVAVPDAGPALSSDASSMPVHTGGLTAQAHPSTEAADRLALLEAVERGEIDIEEALRRLEDREDPDSTPA